MCVTGCLEHVHARLSRRSLLGSSQNLFEIVR
jgi:hypothetical protein